MATSQVVLRKIADLSNRGRLDEAADVTIDALRSAPNSVELLLMLSFIETARDNLDAALAAGTRAAQLEPNSSQAQQAIADVHSLRADHDEAHRAAMSAVQLAPHDPRAYAVRATVARRDAYWVGRLRKTQAQRDMAQQALADINRAIELEPNNPTFHVYKADLLRRGDKIDLARTSCRAALELDPHNADALRLLAAFDINDHKNSSARDHTTAGLNVDPHSGGLQAQMSYLTARRLQAPVGAMSVPATIATLGSALAGGKPGWIVALLTALAVIAAGAYTWHWQQQLSGVERQTMLMGEGKTGVRVAAILWLALLALAIGHLVFNPFPEPSFDADGNRNVGLGEWLWNLGPIVTLIVAVRIGYGLIRSRSHRSTTSAPSGTEPDAATT